MALQCNESDWVRWYDNDYINELMQVKHSDCMEKVKVEM